MSQEELTAERTEAAAPSSELPEEFSLKARTIWGSFWSLFGYGAQQALRLVSNLIITRLLFPEAFGVMALVNVFLQGLVMISDLGLGPSIIQNRRGEDPIFLRTAWTLQFLRGLVIFVLSTLVAFPAARFYNEAELVYLIPVAGLTNIISGLNSMSLFVLNRRLDIARLTWIDLGSQAFGIVVTVASAWVWPSVWSLVIGSLASAFAKAAASHLIRVGTAMWFTWEPSAARELFHFGRWIFISSLFTFLIGNVDRIVLGKFMTMGDLGIYSIASFLSGAVAGALQTVSGAVLFPVYSRLAEQGAERLRSRTFQVRAALALLGLPPLFLLTLWGPWILHILYDTRYEGGGWMLQLRAGASCFGIISMTISPVLLAVGNSFRHMILLAAQSLLFIVCMFVGGYLYSVTGLLLGIGAAQVLTYPITVMCVRRYGVWLPALDAACFLISAAVCVVAWLLH
ncbi:MAG TPA: oligosaccharide flippase family protein [Candidatus Hydrogenedentes bacterium]|nr:oligosaccharide flippase family protein [Candidatus Hydrogenedentota bacterium]HOL77845.1 oligosaccharide flippase family protein [Candidatus Hydrogenedentota bacterium]HPO86190.1 oligosaccharide flippase family protein [Candidatus Hydrogenedentota bacterium]